MTEDQASAILDLQRRRANIRASNHRIRAQMKTAQQAAIQAEADGVA